MGKTLFSLTFATALLALASSEASAFVYSSFVCQAVGARSVGWGRSFFDCPEPMRTSQRNLHHQLLRSGVLIFPQSGPPAQAAPLRLAGAKPSRLRAGPSCSLLNTAAERSGDRD
jgi:hypothetical protein